VENARPGGHRIIQFGGFEVDLRAGELRKQGTRIRLQEQPLQILQILLENHGEVVTREELRRRIWPANTFVDFDHGLNNAIKRLREALGDTAERPQYIETLPKKGYRCIAPISAISEKIESLAVLPLENLSGDPEQEYFAEGLTEALITTLAKVGELRVVSRTSVMQYKGVHKPLREIARELAVDAVVEGTVLRAGRRVRITAQLIDAAKEAHLWAESYERDLRDVLTLQSEVAQAVAREVQVKLTPQEQAHLGQVHPVNPEAYEAYLKGRYYWNRRSREGVGKATEHFQQAITKDPTYAAAHSGLADCLIVLGYSGLVAPNEGCGRAKELALRALEIDRGLAEAHASLAFATMWYDYDFLTAEREFERSLELNPRYVTGHAWFGLYLTWMGRYEEAYTELKRAARLDPCSSIVYFCLGILHWAARRYDQAIEEHARAIELEPRFAAAHAFQGNAYRGKSLYEQAVAALQTGIQLSQNSPTYVAVLGETYATAGNRDEAQRILEQLGALSRQRYVSPYGVALLNLALGKTDEALSCLEASYRVRDVAMVMLKVDPRFDGLRSDPRFQDLLRHMKFLS
jgi:TolB-like protein/Tfp pilus assembly protein PilF